MKSNGFTSVLVLLLLLAGLLSGVFLLYRGTRVQAPATTPGGVGEVTLQPLSKTAYPGDRFSSTIQFRTGPTTAQAVPISAISLRISYPYTGVTPQLDVVDAGGLPSNTITPDPTLATNGWSYNVKSVTRTGGFVTIDIGMLYQNSTNPALGYSTATFTSLGTINFKANAVVASPVVLAFNTLESRMYTKSDPATDILNPPPSASYSIINDATAPSAVSNLAVSTPTTNSMVLGWSSPADVGPAGNAASYDLRYSTSSITAANFATATQVSGEPVPKTAGQAETLTVSGLNPNTSYFFALTSRDAAGNVSAISNVPTGTTLNPVSTLTFGYKLQGLAISGLSSSGTLTLSGATTQSFSFSGLSGAGGVIRPTTPIQLGSLPIGVGGTTYTAFIQDASHLRKNMGSVTLSFGINSAPVAFDSISLKAGDFVNSALVPPAAPGDNKITIEDTGKIISQYTQLVVPVTAGNQVYDVNGDARIDIYDLSIVLSNYTAPTIFGD